jgi:Icc-related predicted phosphoesterase
MKYVHGEVISIEGVRFGFIGGGVETPLKADGEMSDQAMAAALEEIGEVDVLCTHVPPAIPELRTDVITGRAERGSDPVLEYINRFQPRLHLFGDVHQPKARNWRLGQTVCRNVGYFRATGTPYELDTARFA